MLADGAAALLLLLLVGSQGSTEGIASVDDFVTFAVYDKMPQQVIIGFITFASYRLLIVAVIMLLLLLLLLCVDCRRRGIDPVGSRQTGPSRTDLDGLLMLLDTVVVGQQLWLID
jgi:hypothetical protein